jgi:hypothetical protein
LSCSSEPIISFLLSSNFINLLISSLSSPSFFLLNVYSGRTCLAHCMFESFVQVEYPFTSLLCYQDQNGTQPTRETVDSAALSLLSLSMAASSAMQIPASSTSQPEGHNESFLFPSGSLGSVSSAAGGANYNGSHGAVSVGNGVSKHHRRLSSTGQTRRRLSDARDAAVRPS